eukprot:1192945-Prorocentrum_minimum.AAC.4
MSNVQDVSCSFVFSIWGSAFPLTPESAAAPCPHRPAPICARLPPPPLGRLPDGHVVRCGTLAPWSRRWTSGHWPAASACAATSHALWRKCRGGTVTPRTSARTHVVRPATRICGVVIHVCNFTRAMKSDRTLSNLAILTTAGPYITPKRLTYRQALRLELEDKFPSYCKKYPRLSCIPSCLTCLWYLLVNDFHDAPAEIELPYGDENPNLIHV